MKRCFVWTFMLWLALIPAAIFALDHPVSSSSEPTRVTILVDAGHGGKDPGGVSAAGIREKDLNLTIARQIGSLLQAHSVQVLYTREDDQSVAIQQREKLVLESRPDVLVSVHMNGAPGSSASGFSMFIDEGSEQAIRLAWKIEEQLRGLGLLRDTDIHFSSFFMANEMAGRPSVILEIGYITNPEDVAVVSDPANQMAISTAAVSGILAWLPEMQSQSAK